MIYAKPMKTQKPKRDLISESTAIVRAKGKATVRGVEGKQLK